MISAKLKTQFLDFFFPQHLKCHSCDREAAVNSFGICKKCEEQLLFVSDPGSIEGIDAFRSGLRYNEVARRAMISFKYYGAVYKKEFLTHFIEVPEEWNFDCFIPVPMHIDRLKKRGYNQSTVIAAELSKRCGKPVREDLLVRVRNTPQQARLDREARMKNVRGAFRANDELNGLSVVLVDDMRTTGATLRECALELKKHGAVRVYAITACCSMEESGYNE